MGLGAYLVLEYIPGSLALKEMAQSAEWLQGHSAQLHGYTLILCRLQPTLGPGDAARPRCLNRSAHPRAP